MIHPTKVSTICIVGGGSSAHVLIPFLSQSSSHTIHLLTRKPDEWHTTITCDLTNMANEVTQSFEGKIHKKSNEPEQVIPDADIIVLCMPVHSYRGALRRIGPYISKEKKEVYIGTIYGQAGFNWMVHDIEKAFNLTNLIIFAIGLIPWICRTLCYGSKVANYGGKEVNVVAVTPKEKFTSLDELFLEDISLKPLGKGKFVQACCFLSLTLSVDNQIIHPARCYGLWTRYGGRWSSLDTVPFFYKVR
jgi:ketopantoate reductase